MVNKIKTNKSAVEKQKKLIIVNSRESEWLEKTISYEQLVVIAFGSYVDDATTIYTITYSRGEKPNHEGFLVKGSIIKIKEGMVFNVTQTNKS